MPRDDPYDLRRSAVSMMALVMPFLLGRVSAEPSTEQRGIEHRQRALGRAEDPLERGPERGEDRLDLRVAHAVRAPRDVQLARGLVRRPEQRDEDACRGLGGRDVEDALRLALRDDLREERSELRDERATELLAHERVLVGDPALEDRHDEIDARHLALRHAVEDATE